MKKNGTRRLLDNINTPKELKKIPVKNLPTVAAEIRELILNTVSVNGGHLAASLGTVELIIALHYVLNAPKDKIVWDVGHQAYAHKILTGRREQFHTLRQSNGLSGFPNIEESEYDHFTVGHASTSISQALGLAVARNLRKGKEKIVAVCGDGSLTGGLCYEALNNAGRLKGNFTVILNDNKMAISKSIGAMSHYLNRIITAPVYNRLRSEIERTLKPFPALRNFLRQIEETLKNFLVPGIVFEELGFRYFGPFDGHDLPNLINVVKNVSAIDSPCLLHVITKKGKGYDFAEDAPHTYHSASPFDICTGKTCDVIEGSRKAKQPDDAITYTKAFSNSLLRLAERDSKIVAITAAMPEGTGLVEFQEKYSDRFFDVGIAEQHAVSFAGALARDGFKPVCAIYSTFMQRAYDQLIHDVALQKANVTFCLDRGGLTGSDGATHHGVFDFSFMRTVPGSVVASPRDESEMYELLRLGIDYPGVFSIRYPKAFVPLEFSNHTKGFSIGEGEILVDGTDVIVLTLGSMIKTGLDVAALLKNAGIDATVCNMRFVKPLDGELLLRLVQKIKTVITIEEHILNGGFGSAVLEFLAEKKLSDVNVSLFALPNHFVEHGSRDYLLHKYRLSAETIAASVKETLKKCTR